MKEAQTGNGTVGTEPSVKVLAVEWQADEATSVEIRMLAKGIPPVATSNRQDRWPFLRLSDSSLCA